MVRSILVLLLGFLGVGIGFRIAKSGSTDASSPHYPRPPRRHLSQSENYDLMLTQVKKLRGDNNLCYNEQLNQAAQRYADDIAENLTSLHHSYDRGDDGRSLGLSVAATGYQARSIAENVLDGRAFGGLTRNYHQDIERWVSKSNKPLNMLDKSYTNFGYASTLVKVFTGGDGRVSGWTPASIHVQVFATPASGSGCTGVPTTTTPRKVLEFPQPQIRAAGWMKLPCAGWCLGKLFCGNDQCKGCCRWDCDQCAAYHIGGFEGSPSNR